MATRPQCHADERILINLSVWADLAALRAFVYRSTHAAVMRRRREWFEQSDGVYVALWWVAAGHRPSVQRQWLDSRTSKHGPTAYAFSFAQPFDADGQPLAPERISRDDACPAT